MINKIDLFRLDSDRLGCYQIDGQKYFSRLQTAKIHHTSGKFPKWWFHDDVFSSIDWTTAPTESLSQLYKQRAEQLRDSYDYLVLCFSGGADSVNILNTFSTNNIFLDEVMIYHNLSKEQNCSLDQLNSMNAEVIKSAIPAAREFSKANPTTLIRTVDFSELQYQYFLSDKNTDQFINSANSLLTPNTGILSHKWVLSLDYIRLIEQGKRICFITGHEKPIVDFKDGRYSVGFLNCLDSAAFTGSSAPNELFYWTPNLPALIVKQSHVLKQYAQNNPEHRQELKNTRNRENSISTLLYPLWQSQTYQRPKGVLLTYSMRDRWFFSLPDTDPAKANWIRAIHTYWEQLPDEWKNDPLDINKTTKLSFSKQYFLN